MVSGEVYPAEIEKAISSLSSGKAPGDDGIPAEIFACGGIRISGWVLARYSTTEGLSQHVAGLIWINQQLKKQQQQQVP